jgi:hypothetical protein
MNDFFPLDKTIYQTYECERSELHPIWQQTTQAWIDMHPDWKYEFSNYEKRKHEVVSILNLSEYAIKAFDSFDGIIQADIWRYVITSKNSGMYADLDSFPSKSFNELFTKLDKRYELITPPFGHQPSKAPNCSNFIFSENTSIGKELMDVMYRFLEINGYLLKNSRLLLYEKVIDYWFEIVYLNKDKVADICNQSKTYRTEGFFEHGIALKPDEAWRTQNDRVVKKSTRSPMPKLYSKDWDFYQKYIVV